MSLLTRKFESKIASLLKIGNVLRVKTRLISLVLAVSLPSLFQIAFAEEEIQLGVDYFNDAKYLNAYSIFQELESELESSAEFQYYYGLTLLKMGQVRDAVTAMQRAIELDNGNAEYHYGLAKIREVQIDYVNFFRKPFIARIYKRALVEAIERDPQHIGATRELTAYLLDIPRYKGGNAKEGQALLQKLREMDEIAALEVEAISDWSHMRFYRAVELFEVAANMPGTRANIRLRLGKIYLDSKKYGDAIQNLERYIELPKTWEEADGANRAHIYLAIAYFKLGDEKNSRKYALAAKEISLNRKEAVAVQRWLSDFKVEYQ